MRRLLVAIIRAVFAGPVPGALKSNQTENSVFDADQLHALDEVDIRADEVDYEPDPPAFQLLLNHHKRADNTHGRRERVEVGEGTGLAEQYRKQPMQVLRQRTQTQRSNQPTRQRQDQRATRQAGDAKLVLPVGFICAGMSPAPPAVEVRNHKKDLQKHIGVQLNLVKQEKEQRDTSRPDGPAPDIGPGCQPGCQRTRHDAKELQVTHGVAPDRKQNRMNVEEGSHVWKKGVWFGLGCESTGYR